MVEQNQKNAQNENGATDKAAVPAPAKDTFFKPAIAVAMTIIHDFCEPDDIGEDGKFPIADLIKSIENVLWTEFSDKVSIDFQDLKRIYRED